jgi:hypothetical protein
MAIPANIVPASKSFGLGMSYPFPD